MDDNDIDFDADVAIGDVKQLTEAVEKLKAKMIELDEAEKKVKKLKAEIQKLESQEIPDQMDACSVKEITLESGEKVTVKPIVKANLPTKGSIDGQKDENKKAELIHRLRTGMDWLRNNGGEELITNKIVVEFSKGQDNIAGDFEGMAVEHELPFVRDTSVHNATLSKFVSERMKDGKEIPMETLGVYCGRKAQVKKAR